MRILHIWDCAGVSGVLAKYQRRLGHDVRVIKRLSRDGYNLGINECYGIELIPLRVRSFYPYMIKEARKWDLIHLHTPLFLPLPFIRKPVVLHFHGSDLRVQRNTLRKLFVIQNLSNIVKILVATPDLLDIIPDAMWLPTPIDLELFYPRTPPDPPLTLPVPHERMADYLSQLPIYVQPPTKPWALSKTSLEALACGVPVQWNGLTISPPLPRTHHAEHVVKTLEDIYLQCL